MGIGNDGTGPPFKQYWLVTATGSVAVRPQSMPFSRLSPPPPPRVKTTAYGYLYRRSKKYSQLQPQHQMEKKTNIQYNTKTLRWWEAKQSISYGYTHKHRVYNSICLLLLYCLIQ